MNPELASINQISMETLSNKKTAKITLILGAVSIALFISSCAPSGSKKDPSYFAADPAQIEASRDYIAGIDEQDRAVAHEERMSRARARSKANENAPDTHSTVILPFFW